MSKKSKMELSALGFEDAQNVIIPRLVMSVCGLEKQGKTHFGLSAPGPIALFDTDVGGEGVIHKFDKEIYRMDIGLPAEEEEDEAEDIWDRFREGYYHALGPDSGIRTLLIDTGTELWELLRLARFGKLTQVMPYQYGPVNAEFRKIIRDAYKYDKNVVFLHKMKSEYLNDKRTGNYERAGFSDMGFLVQLNAQVWRYDVDDGGEFCITIKDSRHEPSLAGEDLEGMMCNFQTVAMMALPGVDAEEWE